MGAHARRFSSGTIVARLHIRRESLGFVHRSRTIFCRPAKPNRPIRNFSIAVTVLLCIDTNGVGSCAECYGHCAQHKMNLPPVEARQTSVECIVPYSKGFIVGSDRGLVTLYEKLDETPYYRKGKTFTLFEHETRVTNISLNPVRGSDAGACGWGS